MYRTLTAPSATTKSYRLRTRPALLPLQEQEPPDPQGAKHRPLPSRERGLGRVRIDRYRVHQVMLAPVLADRRTAARDDVAIPVRALAEGHGNREPAWDAQPHHGRRIFATRASAPVPQKDIQRDMSLAGDPGHEAVQDRCEETEDPSRERPLGLSGALRD